MNTSSQQQIDLSGAREFAPEPEQLLELLQSFEQSLSTEMGVIEKALASNDKDVVERSLHALKGFIPLFAKENLAQAVAKLYSESRQQSLQLTKDVYLSMLPSLNILLSEVRAWPGIYDSSSQ
jgi:HPt (histidine-containing phosphotransfer) domain-containing protein